MFRTSFIIFLILSAIITGMLFWQWEAFSEKNDRMEGKELEAASQEVTIESKQTGLEISQHIKGLTTGKEYRIEVPKGAVSFKCLKEDGELCESMDENPASFAADEGNLCLEYTIPVSKKAPSWLFLDWLIQLPDVAVKKTRVDLVDSARREGSWVAGIPLKGHEKLDYIDYYVFEGESSLFSLYWQAKPLQQQKGPKELGYFIEGTAKIPPDRFETIESAAKFPYMTVILTNEHAEMAGKGIIIAGKQINKNVLEKKIIEADLMRRFTELPPKEVRWLADALSAGLTNQPTGNIKGADLLRELDEKLSDEQLQGFYHAVLSSPLLTVQELDQALKEAVGMGTHFFSLNKAESAKFLPLYFHDSKKVEIDGKLSKSIEVLYKEEKTLFPFEELMQELGFRIEATGRDPIVLLKNDQSYHFYLQRNIFSLNGEEYGLLEKPLISFNGKVYMEEQWLRSIFNLWIQVDGERMLIRSQQES